MSLIMQEKELPFFLDLQRMWKDSDLSLPSKCLTIIIFFSSLISVLYYLGIMQLVIKLIGGAFIKTAWDE